MQNNFYLGRINQYFDGKRTDDEILFRAEITRKQLREVLHHYDEYVRLLNFIANVFLMPLCSSKHFCTHPSCGSPRPVISFRNMFYK